MAAFLLTSDFRGPLRCQFGCAHADDGEGVAGAAAYNARHGGARLDKFGPTAEKIRPLLTELFASASPGGLPPATSAAPTDNAALATTNASAGARLKELALLKEQALITDEEYDDKLRAILDEI